MVVGDRLPGVVSATPCSSREGITPARHTGKSVWLFLYLFMRITTPTATPTMTINITAGVTYILTSLGYAAYAATALLILVVCTVRSLFVREGIDINAWVFWMSSAYCKREDDSMFCPISAIISENGTGTVIRREITSPPSSTRGK